MIIGIIGGGQLAMFLSDAAKMAGHSCIAISDYMNSPASKNCEMVDTHDQTAVLGALNKADIITFETENVPEHLRLLLSQYTNIYPSLHVLSVSSDRLLEKKFLRDLQIETAAFYPVATLDEYHTISADIHYQGLIKTRKGGYDGYGQSKLTPEINDKIMQIINAGAIIEEFIHFNEEISILSGRNQQNQIYHFPITKNQHQNGILIQSDAPYHQQTLQLQAESIAEKILHELNYIGLLAVEFFVKDQRLIVNEIAPRVHNSGHWTLDGANYSQFQCHIACITNQALPTLKVTDYTTMLNIIGKKPMPSAGSYPAKLAIYDYHKEVKPGRKCGHVNITSASPATNDLTIKLLKETERH